MRRSIVLLALTGVLVIGAHAGAAVVSGSGALTLSGTVRWTDSAGGWHPIRSAPVEIRPAAGGPAVAQTSSTEDGRYKVTVAAPGDYLVRVLALGPGFRVQSVGGEIAALERPVSITAHAVFDLTAGNAEDRDTAFSVAEALRTGTRYVERINHAPPADITVIYPDESTFQNGDVMHVGRVDRFDWDLILHEYGHQVLLHLGIVGPGGNHFPTEHLSEFRGKDIGTQLAWNEGWATYFSISLQRAMDTQALGIPHVGDFEYTDTEDVDLSTDVETQTATFPSRGEDNELSVQRVLWDLYDSADDDGDFGIALGDQALWDAVKQAKPTTLSGFIRALADGQADGDFEPVGCVLAEHAVAPARVSPAEVSPRQSRPPTFTWNPNGGGPSFRNDRFVVELYDGSLSRPLFTSAPRSQATFTPTRAEWRDIRRRAHDDILWLVRGSQTASPETGPYVGCSRTLASPAAPDPTNTPWRAPFRTVAEIGQSIPGGGQLLDHFELGGSDRTGDVAFVANVDSAENQGLFISHDGRLTEIARAGDTVAGQRLGPGSADAVAVDDDGSIAFSWFLGPPDFDPFGEGAGLFRADDQGRVRALVIPEVTRAPGGGVFHGSSGAAFTKRGGIAFAGIVDTPSGLGSGVFVVQRDGTIVPVMRPGDAAPGGGTFRELSDPPESGGDDVVFSATVGTDFGEGVYVWRASTGRLEVVARPGTPAAGGGVLDQAYAAHTNARGDVLFGGTIIRPDGSLVDGLYLAMDGRIVTIAETGDAMPDHWLFGSLRSGNRASSVNDRREVAFVATTYNPDIGVTHGVYTTSRGRLELVARDGSSIPRLGVVTSVDPSVRTAFIDDHGTVLIHVRTENRQVLVATGGR